MITETFDDFEEVEKQYSKPTINIINSNFLVVSTGFRRLLKKENSNIDYTHVNIYYRANDKKLAFEFLNMKKCKTTRNICYTSGAGVIYAACIFKKLKVKPSDIKGHYDVKRQILNNKILWIISLL